MDNTVLGDSLHCILGWQLEYFDNIFTNEHFINLIYVHELNLFSSDLTTYYFFFLFWLKVYIHKSHNTILKYLPLILKDNMNMILV